MTEEIKYMLRIQIKEIFKNIRMYVFIYTLIILLSSVLYLQDFSMKMTANLVVIIWIALMSVIGVKVFTEDNKGSLFVISRTPIFLKYARIIFVQIIFNLPLLVCMYLQLFFIGRDFFQCLCLVFISYLFSVMLGLLLGNTFSQTTGLIVLVFVFIYNLFFCQSI